MKKALERICKFILNIFTILVVAILIILLYYFLQVSVLKKEYVNIFGYTVFQVATGSMSGTIEIGDVVIAKITNDVNENDIIIFKQDGNYITHRIIKIEDDQITTKGDANNSEDSPITKDDVLGKVVKIIPNVGVLQEVITTPAVAISGTVAIILFIIAFSYKDMPEEENIKNEEETLDNGTKNKKEETNKQEK